VKKFCFISIILTLIVSLVIVPILANTFTTSYGPSANRAYGYGQSFTPKVGASIPDAQIPQTVYLASVTLRNADTTISGIYNGNAYLDVYSNYTNMNSPGTFVGSSSNTVNPYSAGLNAQITFNFNNLALDKNTEYAFALSSNNVSGGIVQSRFRNDGANNYSGGHYLDNTGWDAEFSAVFNDSQTSVPTPTPTPTPLSDYTIIRSKLTQDLKTTWLYTGDSITHGCLHTNGNRNFVEHYQERVRWELNHKSDFCINTGISGNFTTDILNDFTNRVTRFNPGVVFVMLGMNDCTQGVNGRETFRTNLGSIVDNIRAIGAVPVLMTSNEIYYAGDASRTDLPNYMQIVREVAGTKNVVLIDHFAYWQSAQPDQTTLRNTWLNDAIHPNQIGHLEMAKKIFRDLGIFDPASATCSLTNP
jgi:acyl-CoA thioesterase-1